MYESQVKQSAVSLSGYVRIDFLLLQNNEAFVNLLATAVHSTSSLTLVSHLYFLTSETAIYPRDHVTAFGQSFLQAEIILHLAPLDVAASRDDLTLN